MQWFFLRLCLSLLVVRQYSLLCRKSLISTSNKTLYIWVESICLTLDLSAKRGARTGQNHFVSTRRAYILGGQSCNTVSKNYPSPPLNPAQQVIKVNQSIVGSGMKPLLTWADMITKYRINVIVTLLSYPHSYEAVP